MTHPLIMMLPYSMKIFTVKTFVNCPETTKFMKSFTRKRFLLYGRPLFRKFNFGNLPINHESAKIGPHENFPLYNTCIRERTRCVFEAMAHQL